LEQCKHWAGLPPKWHASTLTVECFLFRSEFHMYTLKAVFD
jgi:hypothetical protein